MLTLIRMVSWIAGKLKTFGVRTLVIKVTLLVSKSTLRNLLMKLLLIVATLVWFNQLRRKKISLLLMFGMKTTRREGPHAHARR